MASTAPDTSRLRHNLPLTRGLVVPFVVLAGAGAVSLYGFPGRTDELFAWTLAPPPSALFMGAGYAAGVVLTVQSYRNQPWVVTRTATFTIFAFVAVMTGATFLHLDKFHFTAGPITARFAAWAWLLVYVVITPVLLVVIVRQQRLGGVDPPRTDRLPNSLRVALGIQCLALLAIGVALATAPEAMDAVWPWQITALAGRALASWLIAIGVASGWAMIENDVRRTRPAAVTFMVLGGLWLTAALRGSADMRWERVSSWAYVAIAALAIGLGAWGWRLAVRAGRVADTA